MKKILFIVVALGLAQWWFTDPNIDVPGSDISFSYAIEYTGNSSRSDTLPMLVALHGNGDTPANFYETALDELNIPARVILLQAPISKGRGYAWPWLADDFFRYGQALNDAIELLVIKYPTIKKPVLIGFSGGGMMAYYQALAHGDHYTSILPVSGDLQNKPSDDLAIRSGAKVHAFHGKSDRVVSMTAGKDAVRTLRDNNIRVKFSEFEGGHHGIFTNMKTEITKAVEQNLLATTRSRGLHSD